MLHTTPDEAFDIVMKIHVRAPFRLIRQAAPYFRLTVRRTSSFFRETLTTFSTSLNIAKTAPSSTSPPPVAFMEMLAKLITLQPKQQSSASQKPLRKSGVHSASEQTQLRLDSFILGPFRSQFHLHKFKMVGGPNLRLTAAKEAGATMEIGGKRIALGVPGAKGPSEQTTPDDYPLIPLRRGGTPEDAAGSILL
jgi:3-oxoacyl-[acyl-carrier protein] reductase